MISSKVAPRLESYDKMTLASLDHEDNLAFRELFFEKIGGAKEFYRVPVKEGCKVVMPFFKLDSNNNYGLVPSKGGRTFILDIDSNDKYMSVDEQIDFFSEFFDVNLRATLTVCTPNNGYHCYIRLPDGFTFEDFPNFAKSSLTKDSTAFSLTMNKDVKIKADIRTTLSTSFVVGPGSYFIKPSDPKDKSGNSMKHYYTIASEDDGFSPRGIDAEIQEVTLDGLLNIENFCQRTEDIKVKDNLKKKEEFLERGSKRKGSKLVSDVLKPEDMKNKSDSLPGKHQMGLLSKAIKDLKDKSFHVRRAYVKTVLHCCFVDSVIEDVCVRLEIDKDTHRDGRISEKELRYDVRNFMPSYARHNRFCGKIKSSEYARFESANKEPLTTEEIISNNKSKVAARKISRNEHHRRIEPKVIDVAKISEKLRSKSLKRKTPPQQYFDALKIVDYFLQPLSNVGAKTIVLARSAVMERLELTESRASQAMKILRESGVIEVHTKQKTGMAATYRVPHFFTDDVLTRTLRMAWGFNGSEVETGEKFHANVYLDRETLSFREVFTHKVVKTNANFIERRIHLMNESVESWDRNNYGPGAALSYLKSEAETRGVKVVDHDTVIDESTGEIISEASEVIAEDNEDRDNVAILETSSFFSDKVSINLSFISRYSLTSNLVRPPP